MAQPPQPPEIASPCAKICVIEPASGYCIGCGRTREEIAGWIAMSPAEREANISQLPERLANLTRNRRRNGGRRGRMKSHI